MEQPRPTYSSQLPPPVTPRRVAGVLLGFVGLWTLAEAVGLFGEVPLHHAARLGSARSVRVLLGVYDPDTTTRSGSTALHLAAGAGHTEVVSVLIEAGAGVDVRRQRGLTPLYLAAMGGHAEVASVLIEAGADVDAQTDYGSTPLSTARLRNHRAVVALLEQAGAYK